MNTLMKYITLFLLTCFFSTISYSQVLVEDSIPIVGQWTGTLVARGTSFDLVFDIEYDEDEYLTRLDIPVQKIKGMPITITTYEGCILTLDLYDLRCKYITTVTDSNTLTGYFEQGGDRFLLNLTKINPHQLTHE